MNIGEQIEIVVGVASLWIAWSTYRKSFPKISKDEELRQQEQLAFQAYYKTVQRTAKEVRESIEKFAIERG